MNKKLLVFNWKSAPATVDAAIKLAKAVESGIPKKNAPEIVIAPPFLFIEEVGKFVKKTKLGSQDVFWKNIGPYTGEISLRQEKNLKVKYVIIGHSERRRILGETDTMINKKVLATLKAGLKVILCVGEPKRELGIKNYELKIKKAKNYVKNQLKKDLRGIHNSLFKIHNSLIIAYEPVWAIGTGHSDSPEDAVEMIKFIKKTLNSRVLYGGSVNSKNIKNFVKYKEVDGFLIGGASLKPKEIKNIIKSI